VRRPYRSGRTVSNKQAWLVYKQHRGSRPRTVTPAVQASILRRARQKPYDDSTHWTCRKLAEESGVSKSTVQRVLTQAKLRPHRLDR